MLKNNGLTYKISVSLCKGVYRHIEISSESTLEELHSAILDAFEFFDDHAHAFFMDNKAWSQEDCYYADFIEDDYRFTCDYTIGEVLKEGQSFKYVFDFGYDWRFQCKVLKIEDKPCDEDRVVRSVGEAPEQYADCDDWE